MHPTLVARPFHRAGWVYEEKVDGWRMVAIKIDGRVRLVSRNGRDLTTRFPELVKALGGLRPPAFVLDGEVAVYDHAFISRFEWLHGRPKDKLATLPVYMVFDLLELDGKDLRGEPLKVRRRLLERVVGGHGMIFAARRLSRNGLKAWEEALARGFEGLVAKNPESRYVPGRTLAWFKVISAAFGNARCSTTERASADGSRGDEPTGCPRAHGRARSPRRKPVRVFGIA